MAIPDDDAFTRRPSVREEFVSKAASPLGRQLAGIALGVMLVFAIGAVYIFGMKSAGKALSRAWEENAGYPSLDETRGKTVLPATYSEIRTSCKARADKASLPRSQRDAIDHFQGAAVGEDQLVMHAAFLDCLMSQMPSRFCIADHKAHLVENVKNYFKLRGKVREEWMMTMNNPFGIHRMGLGGSDTEGVRMTLPSKQTDPRIVSGLRTLITNGYLKPSDIGGGMFSSGIHRDLTEALKGVEPKKKSCG